MIFCNCVASANNKLSPVYAIVLIKQREHMANFPRFYNPNDVVMLKGEKATRM